MFVYWNLITNQQEEKRKSRNLKGDNSTPQIEKSLRRIHSK